MLWAMEQQAVVDGNHLEIIKPKSSQDLPVRIVGEEIQGYHGINLCFLSSQRLSSAGIGKERDIAALAREVLVHCSQSPRDFWCLGTVGEANLVLGKQVEALAAYRSAVEFTPEPEPWHIQSMHSQASQLAAVLGYHTLLKTLHQIFRPKV